MGIFSGDFQSRLEFERAFLNGTFEKNNPGEKGLLCVGVDEVGRGCLAGPVVASAVVLPKSVLLCDASVGGLWTQINDSKKLSASKRKELSDFLWSHALVQVAWCQAPEIDQLNILGASFEAMRQCLEPFQGLAQVILVDGHMDPFAKPYGPGAPLPGFQKVLPLVKGDSRSLSIAAASIVAKVFRDQWMEDLDGIYPQYEFSKHKGYPTPLHKQRIAEHGVCELHRLTFCRNI